jgi:hypothetical protein
MNNKASSQLTALDELVCRNPAIESAKLAQARQAAELLRKLGLLSTEPATAIRPFTRRRPVPSGPAGENNWAAAAGIQFTKLD